MNPSPAPTQPTAPTLTVPERITARLEAAFGQLKAHGVTEIEISTALPTAGPAALKKVFGQ